MAERSESSVEIRFCGPWFISLKGDNVDKGFHNIPLWLHTNYKSEFVAFSLIVLGFLFLRDALSCWKTALEDNSSVLFCWNWDWLINTRFISHSQVLVLSGYFKISSFTRLEQNFCSLLIKLSFVTVIYSDENI